jgi:ABC-type polysaccharide/polyol phosphate export permease
MQTTLAVVPAPISSQPLFRLAIAGWRDLIDGAAHWRLCYLMGSGDIRRRYARSRLGQLWIMVSSTIMVASMGLVWSYLWKQPIRELLPYVAIGMVTWQLLLGVITEATVAIPANSKYFHNQYISASTIIYAVLYRNGVTFLLNVLFPLLICLAFRVNLTPYAVLSLFGLVLVAITSTWVSFVIAFLCTRYRDIVQIITSSLQIIFFLTPVVWKPEILSEHAQSILQWNPFAVFIAIVRDPLLGRPVPAITWAEAFVWSFGGLALALPFIGRFRRRLIYWL